MDNTEKSAIKRNKPSAPLLYLLKKKLIKGKVLDYGCGYGVDAEKIGADKFDPNFWNHRPTRTYNQILCFYVLNVVDSGVNKIRIIRDMWKLLKTNGKIFFALRNDIDVLGYDKGWEEYGIRRSKTGMTVDQVSTNIYTAGKW